MASFMSFIHHLPWVTIFGLLGNVISMLMCLSPAPTFYRIYKKKSTEGYQCVPYIVTLFSGMLWIFYAFYDPNSTFILTINSFTVFLESVYIVIFLFYGTKEARITAIKLFLLINVAGFGAIAFVVLVIAKSNQMRLKIMGWICLIFAVSVFVAPLGVMRQVIRTKSVEYMPFLLSLFLTLNAITWFFYGLIKHDYYVALPNVVGFIFSLAQMVLYAIYRKSKETVTDEDPKGKNLLNSRLIKF
ncbi:hypothetical protein Nepgr_018559 [Nepenthes gracilis]|uniref:Bidirectional sugar transporter SWEET n=1 Tax=Nepenthes gracilis TaxID=150966 RepID=A0AAD3SSG5_NEPGR|nr:hypothetical protein Nepgr_018559 [Nepenthes gracilis]